MRIEIKIPYSETGQLADAYNLALTEGTSEWVLFLDHDVFLCCNPRWYHMCLQAVETLKKDPKAACIACIAGGEWHKKKKKNRTSVYNDRIQFHIENAKKAYQQYGNTLVRREKHVTGFFLLVNRKIASEIGFVQIRPGSIYNIDIDFGNRVLEAGYHNYTMPGLYVYHRRGMSHLKKEFIKND